MKPKVADTVRRIPLSRRSHVTGFQSLATGKVQHESALERDFVTLTSFQDGRARITSQPVTLEYCDGLRTRRYTPDFLVHWSDDRRELVEVKYRKDLHEHWARLKPGFVAARQWAHEHGTLFRIATECRIRRGELENVKRLLPLREAPLDPEAEQQVLGALRFIPQQTFAQVLDALRVPRGLALTTLWRMIARGALHADLSVPVGLHTLLSLP